MSLFITHLTLLSASETEISANTGVALLKHENYNAAGYTQNTEKGWLPGGQLAISSKSRRLKSIFSFAAYGGDIKYQAQLQEQSNGISSSKINEKIMRLSYRFEYQKPRKKYAVYSTASFNDWRRGIKATGVISGENRQYQWWRAEMGVKLRFIDSPRNTLRADIGVAYNFFTEMLLDLTPDNLGKPLFKLKNKPGGAINIAFKHRFTKNHSGEIFANAKYWQFGNSRTRTISNNVKSVTRQEYESQSLIFALGATYLYLF